METTPAQAALDAIRLINENAVDTYALTFNSRTNKWLVLFLHADNIGQSRVVRAISAGDTPEMAARDALILRMPSSKAVPY